MVSLVPTLILKESAKICGEGRQIAKMSDRGNWFSVQEEQDSTRGSYVQKHYLGEGGGGRIAVQSHRFGQNVGTSVYNLSGKKAQLHQENCQGLQRKLPY